MRILFFSLKGLACLALAFSCISCGAGSRPVKQPERKLYQWNDDGGEGKVSIRISLSDQIAEFERGGRPIGWCFVATGKEGHGTSAGNYKITEKIEDKYSNRYGWMEDEFGNVVDGDAKYNDKVPEGLTYIPAPMPYWMRLTSYGIGMHGGLIPEPGVPASHGCIRMPKKFVPLVFDSVVVGTAVVITREGSRQGETLETIEVEQDVLEPPRRVDRRVLPQAGYIGDGRVISSRPLTDVDMQRLGRASNTNPATPYYAE